MSFLNIDPKETFPILNQKVGNHPLVFVDSSSYTPTPRVVIEKISHLLSSSDYETPPNATEATHMLGSFFDRAREKVRRFINAPSDELVSFHLSSTQISNFLCDRISETLSPEDEILFTAHEYSSSIGPWQVAAKKHRLRLRFLSDQKDQIADIEEYKSMFTGRVKVVCLNALSTYTGLVLDLKEYIRIAHEHGAIVLVDASYAAAHMKIDVQDLDCEFLYFSGYKLYALSGVGCLYGKREHLLKYAPPLFGPTPPAYSRENFILSDLPGRQELGTSGYVAAYSLGEAIDFIDSLGGIEAVVEHEKNLRRYLIAKLEQIPGARILDRNGIGLGCVGFTIDGVSHTELHQFLDNRGIHTDFRTRGKAPDEFFKAHSVRDYLRSGVGIHNTQEDIDRLVEGIFEGKKALGVLKSRSINMHTGPRDRLEVVKFDPPILSDAHIGTREVGFRPYRKRGPNLDVVPAGEQVIFQNYGHASTGWSISPATTVEVVDKINGHFHRHELDKSEPIAIIGAGIVGTLAAQRLVEEGYKNITMYAKDFNNTTSHIASGHFTPEDFASNTEYLPQEKIREWVKTSYDFWDLIVQKKHPTIDRGARKVRKIIYQNPERVTDEAITSHVFTFRPIIADFGTIRHHVHLTEDYIAYETRDVMSVLRENMIGHVKQRVQEVNDHKELSEKIVVNCAGLGSDKIIDDPELTSYLGHHLYLKNQNGLDLDYVVGGTLGHAPQNGIEFLAKRDPNDPSPNNFGLLGNSAIADTYSPEGHNQEFANVLSRMRKFFNSY